jgi:hypothetical protein
LKVIEGIGKYCAEHNIANIKELTGSLSLE